MKKWFEARLALPEDLFFRKTESAGMWWDLRDPSSEGSATSPSKSQRTKKQNKYQGKGTIGGINHELDPSSQYRYCSVTFAATDVLLEVCSGAVSQRCLTTLENTKIRDVWKLVLLCQEARYCSFYACVSFRETGDRHFLESKCGITTLTS